MLMTNFLFQMTNFVFNDTFDTVDSIRPDSTLVRKNYDKKSRKYLRYIINMPERPEHGCMHTLLLYMQKNSTLP